MAHRWYAARTRPQAEFLAATELERDGFNIFFPIVKDPKPRKGHTDTPLFPGYLFLSCDPEGEGWPLFRPRHRIAGWVNFEGEIPSLPDEAMAELRQRLNYLNREGGLWRRYQPGETVHVVSGSMESLAEVVEEAKSPQARVRVLLHFMGRLVQAQVPWENLRAVEKPDVAIQHAPRRTRGRARWNRGFGPTAVATV